MSLADVNAEFEAIDVEHNGFIDRKTLEAYVTKNHLPKDTVTVSIFIIF